jgi:hypothetical protein
LCEGNIHGSLLVYFMGVGGSKAVRFAICDL